MSNNLNLSDSINFAIASGQTPTFWYNGNQYEFSPAGLIAFFMAEVGSMDPVYTTVTTTGDINVGGAIDAPNAQSVIIVPTDDPEIAGALWNDNGTIKPSEGA